MVPNPDRTQIKKAPTTANSSPVRYVMRIATIRHAIGVAPVRTALHPSTRAAATNNMGDRTIDNAQAMRTTGTVIRRRPHHGRELTIVCVARPGPNLAQTGGLPT